MADYILWKMVFFGRHRMVVIPFIQCDKNLEMDIYSKPRRI